MGMELDVGQAVLLRPGEGERLGERIVVKIERPELSVNEVNARGPFEGASPHFHKEHVDVFFVLEGELEVLNGTETVRAGAGTSVVVPPGIVHGFNNPGPGGVRYLNIHAPDGGFIEYIRRITGDGVRVDWDSYDVEEPYGPAEAIVAGPDGGERFERERGVITIRAARTEISILDLDLERGWPGIGEHVHDDQVDSFFVLEGEPRFGIEGQAVPARVGTFIAVPPGIHHEIHLMDAPARFLNIHAPDAGFADFVRES
jgi:mannose-6-phosphate isomerase-like protein (cupin superfamily)